MKKRTKGIIMFAFLGGIMLTSGIVIAIPNIAPVETDENITITGTPADNYPDEQRDRFCGTGNAKSTSYIKEFKLPTVCAQPHAIDTDPQGNIWIAESNTGNLAKFEPSTETFVEFENPMWPEGANAAMWGLDYSPDGTFWYTDTRTDSIWKFSIEEEKFDRISYPSETESFPQQIKVDGSKIIVNDLHGGKITFLDLAQSSGQLTYFSLPSPLEGYLAAGFDLDANNNLWYTNWLPQQGGILVKFDTEKYFDEFITIEESNDLPLGNFIEFYNFPPGMNTPNGLSVGPDGNIWIADTSSSNFFKFNPDDESFTRYVTSPPPLSSYGNFTGVVKTPVSRPYWTAFADDGRLVFNEQTANRIALFDTNNEHLVEYLAPSKNPAWADCSPVDTTCGLAQMFSFTTSGEKIWFTQWAENNIGFVDTSIPLPYEVDINENNITLRKGESTEIIMTVTPTGSSDMSDVSFVSSTTATFSDLKVKSDVDKFQLDADAPRLIKISISAGQSALSGTHKVLLGIDANDVTVSKYITVKIIQ
ncbi:MAG: lyase [Crenarchaeota archaeon]|nr:MAG: lyase [Thermoproteota archaeon]RDJ32912.1 MAG: lyase [Thermoproteota archaeon]RDJ36006.1 MAG: lyase [Thermoproteota archaeon]RDJ38253.1 MAG: lyase [Thermoproteota archaeon]